MEFPPAELLDVTLTRLNIPDVIAAAICGVAPETLAEYLSGNGKVPLKVWHSLTYFETLMFKHKELKSGEKIALQWAERYLRNTTLRHNHFAFPKARDSEK